MMSSTCIWFGRNLYQIDIVFLFVAAVTADGFPDGHLQPLGSHRPPEQSIEEVDVLPSSRRFYDDYVSKSRPVVFRKAVKSTKIFRKWSDAFLKSEYGYLDVDVEEGKKENRSRGLERIPLAQFINQYRDEDVYMVATIPQPMRKDVELLPVLSCGGYTERLADAVLWFSSGGTNSVLHFDYVENINCLYDGTKDFILIDKIHHNLVDIDDANGSYSRVDVDSVDMEKYPGLGKVPWDVVHLLPGDCVYIPFRWFHQVKSGGNRNVAINVWWSLMTEFDDAKCEGKEASYTTLDNYNLINMTRWALLTGGKTITRNKFKDRVMDYKSMNESEADALLDEMDANQDNLIDQSEFENTFPDEDEDHEDEDLDLHEEL